MGRLPPSSRSGLQEPFEICEGRFRCLHRVDAPSGMGAVWEAVDLRASGPGSRKVACKRVLDQYAHEPAYVARLRREARHAERLASRNTAIVPFVAHFDDPQGQPWLVTRWMGGGSLRQHLDDRASTPFAQILRDLIRIAGALDDGQRDGLSHRDVKPGNILYDELGAAYLGDFGIAYAPGDDDLTRVGHVVGSMRYMAPERRMGGEHRHSDQFSLAFVGVEYLLSDETAFRTWMDGRRTDRTPSLRDVSGRAFPSAVNAVIARATHRDPERRYADCSVFVAALGQALGVRVSAAWSSSIDQRVHDGITAIQTSPPETARGGRASAVRPRIAPAAAAARDAAQRVRRTAGQHTPVALHLVGLLCGALAVYLLGPLAQPLWSDIAWKAFGDFRPSFARGEQFQAWVIHGWWLGGGLALLAQLQRREARLVGIPVAAILAAFVGATAALLAWAVDEGALPRVLSEDGLPGGVFRENGVSLLVAAAILGASARYVVVPGVSRRLIRFTIATTFVGFLLISVYSTLRLDRPGWVLTGWNI